MSAPVLVVRIDSGQQARIAELTRQLTEMRRQRDAALTRAQTAERKLARSDQERNRLVNQNRHYREQLRAIPSRSPASAAAQPSGLLALSEPLCAPLKPEQHPTQRSTHDDSGRPGECPPASRNGPDHPRHKLCK